jgi:hypothetical protein
MNLELIEQLLYDVRFSADATHDALLASYIVESLSETTTSIDELTPTLVSFASTEHGLNDGDALNEQVSDWLDALTANEPLMRAFHLLDAFKPGADCVALHAIDGGWHAARVIAIDLQQQAVSVRFLRFSLDARVALRDVRSVAQLVDPGQFLAASGGAGAGKCCELCRAETRLTAHHLFPRSEHARLLKRNVVDRHTLTTTLACLCRPCHSAVHRAEDNRSLAANWNSVELLATHPSIVRWLSFRKKQVQGA